MQRMRLRILAVAAVAAACAAGAQQATPNPEWLVLKGRDIARIDPAEVSYLLNSAATLAPRPAEDRMLVTANAKISTGDANGAFRLLTRWFAARRGLQFGEWLDVACALDFSIDRRLAAPGDIIHARLEALYLLDQPLSATYTARITLLDAAGKKVAEAKPVRLETLGTEETRLETAKLAAGDYAVRYELLDAAGKTLAAASRPLRLDAALMARGAALEERIARLAGAAAPHNPQRALALEALAGFAEIYGRGTHPYTGNLTERLHPATISFTDPPPAYWSEALRPDEDLALAGKLCDALAAGRDPFAGLSGELRLAARSGDGFRSYRLFIPPDYDAAVQRPLVLVLHGEVGDEALLFDPPGAGGHNALSRAAAAHKFFVLAPRLSVATSADDPAQQKDVLDLLAHIQAAFAVDSRRLFVAGHSHGAVTGLAMVLSSTRPWAGYASLAGPLVRPNRPPQALKTAALYVAGGADPRLPRPAARRLAIQMDRIFPALEYLELPQADHYTLLATAWVRTFNFFDEIGSGTWKKPTEPIPLPDDLH